MNSVLTEIFLWMVAAFATYGILTLIERIIERFTPKEDPNGYWRDMPPGKYIAYELGGRSFVEPVTFFRALSDGTLEYVTRDGVRVYLRTPTYVARVVERRSEE